MTGWISYDSEDRFQEWRLPTEDSVARKLADTEAGQLRYCHEALVWSCGTAPCGAIAGVCRQGKCALARAG